MNVLKKAAALSLEVNVNQVDKPFRRAVVYLEPEEYRSTWLGNKSIYRTRMAMADGGSLTVIAPGLKEFGEDPEIDLLIRKHGYKGTPRTLKAVSNDEDLKNNLSAAAHLIHGSSEGRFSTTYVPGHLSREEIENAGFRYGEMGRSLEMLGVSEKDLPGMNDGYYRDRDGEEFYFIRNPGLGLWAHYGKK